MKIIDCSLLFLLLFFAWQIVDALYKRTSFIRSEKNVVIVENVLSDRDKHGLQIYTSVSDVVFQKTE